MKKSILIIFLLLLGINLNAQSLKILMPDWKTSNAEDVLTNRNFHLPYSPTYKYDRCSDPISVEDWKYSSKYSYPVMMPLLIVAEVPKGAKNVTWNISNDNVQIIAAPQGSQFISKNHVVTPTSNTGFKVSVENPFRVLIDSSVCHWITQKCPSGKEGAERNWKTSDFFDQQRDGIKKCKIVNKEFSLGSNQTYVIILATKPSEKNGDFITASVDELAAKSGSVIKSKVNFITQNLELRDGGGDSVLVIH